MAILKRNSFIRDFGIKSAIAYELYLLNHLPLKASETQAERNIKIKHLIKKI